MNSAKGRLLIYRLKCWPDLPESDKVVSIYRMLSVMSSRAVSRQWILSTTGLPSEQIDQLLERLISENAVEAVELPAARCPR